MLVPELTVAVPIFIVVVFINALDDASAFTATSATAATVDTTTTVAVDVAVDVAS